MTDFDPNWPHGHVTRDGRKARIICTDRDGDEFPIVALVKSSSGEHVIPYRADGTNYDSKQSIINAPAPKRNIELWVNVYSGGVVDVNSSRDNADEAAASVFGVNRIACLHVTGEEGDGL